MIKVSVMYPNSQDATFDMDYYVGKHMPLVQSTLGAAVKGCSAELGIPGQGPYIAMGHLLFDSVEACQTALGSHGPTLMADVPNYTNTQPVMQVSQIKL